MIDLESFVFSEDTDTPNVNKEIGLKDIKKKFRRRIVPQYNFDYKMNSIKNQIKEAYYTQYRNSKIESIISNIVKSYNSVISDIFYKYDLPLKKDIQFFYTKFFEPEKLHEYDRENFEDEFKVFYNGVAPYKDKDIYKQAFDIAVSLFKEKGYRGIYTFKYSDEDIFEYEFIIYLNNDNENNKKNKEEVKNTIQETES